MYRRSTGGSILQQELFLSGLDRRRISMKMIIMGGFLGAGKTSLVLQMARYLAEVSIDDKILKSGGFEVQTMFSGCVCCTMAGELMGNICQIMERFDPDWIIMEVTGVAYPRRIKENLVQYLQMESCQIFCAADAKRWKRLKNAMEVFVRDQLDCADVVFINKIDAVDGKTLEEVDESVRRFNTDAKRFCVSAANTIDEAVWKDIFSA